jgi:hypothetical protein
MNTILIFTVMKILYFIVYFSVQTLKILSLPRLNLTGFLRVSSGLAMFLAQGASNYIVHP